MTLLLSFAIIGKSEVKPEKEKKIMQIVIVPCRGRNRETDELCSKDMTFEVCEETEGCRRFPHRVTVTDYCYSSCGDECEISAYDMGKAREEATEAFMSGEYDTREYTDGYAELEELPSSAFEDRVATGT